MDFVEALKNENITEIRKSPKSDLHNHFVLGGNRQFIFNKTGYYIEPLVHPITSMKEMDETTCKALQTQNRGDKGFILVPLKMAFYCATKRAYTVRHTMRLSEPDQNQRIVSNSPKVKKQGQKNSDEIEFWRAYFFTSSYGNTD